MSPAAENAASNTQLQIDTIYVDLWIEKVKVCQADCGVRCNPVAAVPGDNVLDDGQL